MFSDEAQIQLICSIYSMISEVTELQRAFVTMHVSSKFHRCLLVLQYAFSTLSFNQNLEPICFTFLVISALLVLVYIQLLIYKILSNTWFYILHNMLYIV